MCQQKQCNCGYVPDQTRPGWYVLCPECHPGTAKLSRDQIIGILNGGQSQYRNSSKRVAEDTVKFHYFSGVISMLCMLNIEVPTEILQAAGVMKGGKEDEVP